MKTLTILLIGVATTIAQPAIADHIPNLQASAQQAHLLTSQLATATTPYAQFNGGWNRAARRSVEADHATESLIAALAVGDYCTARDVAERLKEFADDLEDSIEDLRPLPGGPCDHDIHALEHFAEDLDQLAGFLRRETRRLDEQQVVIAPPICTVATPPCNVLPGRGYPYGYDTGYTSPRYRGDAFSSRPYPATPYDSFGPSTLTAPNDVFDRNFDSNSSQNYNNEYTWPSTPAQPLPPGLSNKSKIPPGQLKKVDPSQYGPAFPGASLRQSRHRVSYR